jgi:hypothetical protein
MTTTHVRKLASTTVGSVTIEIFVERDHAAVTLYGRDGWQLRGEDTDATERDILDSLVLLGVPEPEAEQLASEVAHEAGL